MPLSDESLEQFRAIYQKEFAEDIPLEEAREMGDRLLTLYGAIYSPGISLKILPEDF